MVNISQVIVDWDVQGSQPGQTVWYVPSESVSMATARAAFAAFLEGIDGVLSNRATWTLRSSGVTLDSETGALVGTWSNGVPITSTGDGGADPVPNASQMLLRWVTPDIVGGRLVKGRTFIPGFRIDNLDGNGQILPASATAVQGHINTLAATNALVVWHRPKAGTGGSAHAVTGGSVWSEFAVLRHRR